MVAGLIVSETPTLEGKSFTFTIIPSTKDLVVILGYILYGTLWVENLILYLTFITERSIKLTFFHLPWMYRVAGSNALLRSSISNSLSSLKSIITNPCPVYMLLMYVIPLIICCFYLELVAFIVNKFILLDLLCNKGSLLKYKNSM